MPRLIPRPSGYRRCPVKTGCSSQGNVFPPAVVYYDGADYWLSDGFHRYGAAKKAGLGSLKAEIRQGTRRDAVLNAVGANATLRRSREDKRHAVSILLADGEWSKWSNRTIAHRCGVDEKLVRTLRSASAAKPQIARTVERNGKTFEMHTDNIGKKDTVVERRLQRPHLDEQAEPVWHHARQPAEANAKAADFNEHEAVFLAEQPRSTGEAQLRELVSAWSRASADVRQQFLTSIGRSLNVQFDADHAGTAEAASSIEPEPPAAVPLSATEVPKSNRLFEMWKDFKPNTRADGLKWLADNCPSVYRDSHFMITESLVPFRQAVRDTIPEERASFLELARTYQAENQYI